MQRKDSPPLTHLGLKGLWARGCDWSAWLRADTTSITKVYLSDLALMHDEGQRHPEPWNIISTKLGNCLKLETFSLAWMLFRTFKVAGQVGNPLATTRYSTVPTPPEDMRTRVETYIVGQGLVHFHCEAQTKTSEREGQLPRKNCCGAEMSSENGTNGPFSWSSNKDLGFRLKAQGYGHDEVVGAVHQDRARKATPVLSKSYATLFLVPSHRGEDKDRHA